MQIRASLTSAKLTDVDIPYDVNPDLENVIIIDCVREVQGRALGIDMAAKARSRVKLCIGCKGNEY